MSAASEIAGLAYYAGAKAAGAPLRLCPLSQIYTKSVDTSKLSVTSILTYPTEDRAGDVVRPDGGDWSAHKAQPWVGLEHLRWHATDPNAAGLLGQRGIGNRPVVVAWARESLSRPGAPHAVQLKAIDLDGGTWHLPVGTSYFDPSDRLSMQTFALVEQDALPGVSLEFRPELKARRVRHAKSFLENRPAYDFGAWHGLSWVHCAIPVNPGATVCKSLLAATDKLASVLSANRIGGEPLHPVLHKSLSRYVPESNRTTVRIENKAMNPDDQTPETLYDAADTNGDGAVDSQDGPPAKPTVQTHYDFADALLSACDMAKQGIESGEHPAGRKSILSVIKHVTKLAEKLKGRGDTIDAQLSGRMGDDEGEVMGDEDEDETDSELEEGDDEGEDEDEEDSSSSEKKSLPVVDMTRDADGVFAAIRSVYKPRLTAVHKALLAARVVRISKAQVAAAPTVEAQVQPAADDPEAVARLKAVLDQEAKIDKRRRRLAGGA